MVTLVPHSPPMSTHTLPPSSKCQPSSPLTWALGHPVLLHLPTHPPSCHPRRDLVLSPHTSLGPSSLPLKPWFLSTSLTPALRPPAALTGHLPALSLLLTRAPLPQTQSCHFSGPDVKHDTSCIWCGTGTMPGYPLFPHLSWGNGAHEPTPHPVTETHPHASSQEHSGLQPPASTPQCHHAPPQAFTY